MNQERTALELSIQRLISSKKQLQRLAALDIALQLKKANDLAPTSKQIIIDFQEKGKVSGKEQLVLDNILNEKEQYTWDNGLGLYDPTLIKAPTLPPPPSADSEFMQLLNLGYQGLSMPAKKVVEELKSLSQLIDQYKDYEYQEVDYSGNKETVLVGNSFGRIKARDDDKTDSPVEQFDARPLADLWRQ